MATEEEALTGQPATTSGRCWCGAETYRAPHGWEWCSRNEFHDPTTEPDGTPREDTIRV